MHRVYSDYNNSNSNFAVLVHDLLIRTNGSEQRGLGSTLGVILEFVRTYD
jgi:hypothetical protein